MLISVITPTYNRAYILGKCYESLVRQTSNAFEWVVVDDGSTDNTQELIQSFIEENKIKIKYIKQENGGKHVAHNTAVLNSQGELVVCLDSDDVLTENAVERAIAFWQENAQPHNTGILAKRGDMVDRKPICSELPAGVGESTLFDLSNKYGFEGDTILYFRRELLEKNLFKSFEGERFIPETNMYIEIDKSGTLLLLDEVLYLCEYLPDGLTAKYHQLLCKNPNGTADTYYKQMCMAKNFKTKLKFAVLTNIYKSLSKNKKELQFEENKFLLFISSIPAMLIKDKFLKKFER